MATTSLPQPPSEISERLREIFVRTDFPESKWTDYVRFLQTVVRDTPPVSELVLDLLLRTNHPKYVLKSPSGRQQIRSIFVPALTAAGLWKEDLDNEEIDREVALVKEILQRDFKRRRLTREEINSIVSTLDANISFIDRVNRRVLDDIRAITASHIERVTLTTAGLEEYRARILAKFISSLIAAGTPVGQQAGQSLVAPASQLALNSKRSAGTSRNVNVNIEALEEIFKMSANRRAPSSSIHFYNKMLTYEDIYIMRRQLTELKVSDIEVDTETGPTSRIFSEIEAAEGAEPWWYNFCRIQIGIGVESYEDWVVRLKVDSGMLYSHRVTMRQVAQAIEAEINQASLRIVRCFYSPLREGVVDILVLRGQLDKLQSDKAIQGIQEDTARAAVFLTRQAKRFEEFRIKGVSGISRILPVEIPVRSIIYNEVSEGTGDNRTTTLYLNTLTQRFQGLPFERLHYLLLYFGFKILAITRERYNNEAVRLISSIRVRKPGFNGSIQEFLKTEIERVENLVRDYHISHMEQLTQQSARQRGIEVAGARNVTIPTKEEFRLHQISRYVYADTEGSNLELVLLLPNVDPRFTFSNNFREILQWLDIEALRTYLLFEIFSILDSQGANINRAHVSLMISYMTSRGTGTSITYYGIQKQQAGVIAGASFERSLEFIRRGAFGIRESTRGVAAAIMVGRPINLGSGSVQIRIDDEAPLPAPVEIASVATVTQGLQAPISLPSVPAPSRLTELLRPANIIPEASARALNIEPIAYTDPVLRVVATQVTPVEEAAAISGMLAAPHLTPAVQNYNLPLPSELSFLI